MIMVLYRRLASLTLGLWLLAGVMLLLAVGSFSGGGSEGSSINEMALFAWLGVAPFSASWWLWLTIGLLTLLALNTILCSVEALRLRLRGGRLLLVLAPQVMHLGFLFIMLAHLASAKGGFKAGGFLPEGGVGELPGGVVMRLEQVTSVTGPMGMPLDYSATLRLRSRNGEEVRTISPNHPAFIEGLGIYLKQVADGPVRAAYLEVHREPGAGLALAGALLFTVGNLAILGLKRGRRETLAEADAPVA